MKDYGFARRAHSIVEWVIIFSLIPLVFLLVQSSFKRTLQGKVQALTDNVIWTRWGNETQQFGRDINVRSISRTEGEQYLYSKERGGIISTSVDNSDNLYTHSRTTQKEVSAAVEEGSERRLNETNLTQLGGF